MLTQTEPRPIQPRNLDLAKVPTTVANKVASRPPQSAPGATYPETESVASASRDRIPDLKTFNDLAGKDLFDWRKVESLRLVVQISLTLMLVTFCLVKLAHSSHQDSDKALYWGGIMSIVAWWMPSPGSATTPASKK